MILGAAMAWPAVAATETPMSPPWWQPDKLFAQVGFAAETQTVVVGAIWKADWHREWLGGYATLYTEASFGRWLSDSDNGASSSAWVTQLGLTPVLRWQPQSSPDWFFEAGIGANVLAPIFRSSDKRFSTAFNFGDHIAVGRRFGTAREHEVALRLQHFSNAGIRHPNPGENFVQLRYAQAF